MERLPLYQIAIKRLEMPIGRYLLRYVLPAGFGGLLLSVFLFFTLQTMFVGASGIFLLVMFPILGALSALIWPLVMATREAVLIEKEMHMFITRMGILSIGEVNAQSMFDILRQMGDYGALAKEVKAMRSKAMQWNQAPVKARKGKGRGRVSCWEAGCLAATWLAGWLTAGRLAAGWLAGWRPRGILLGCELTTRQF